MAYLFEIDQTVGTMDGKIMEIFAREARPDIVYIKDENGELRREDIGGTKNWYGAMHVGEDGGKSNTGAWYAEDWLLGKGVYRFYSYNITNGN